MAGCGVRNIENWAVVRWIVMSVAIGVDRTPRHRDEAVWILDGIRAMAHSVLHGLGTRSVGGRDRDRSNHPKKGETKTSDDYATQQSMVSGLHESTISRLDQNFIL
jgi:hypothetical protein